MSEYRVELLRNSGWEQEKSYTRMEAGTAQEAADAMREAWPGWYILRISMVVEDWR